MWNYCYWWRISICTIFAKSSVNDGLGKQVTLRSPRFKCKCLDSSLKGEGVWFEGFLTSKWLVATPDSHWNLVQWKTCAFYWRIPIVLTFYRLSRKSREEPERDSQSACSVPFNLGWTISNNMGRNDKSPQL